MFRGPQALRTAHSGVSDLLIHVTSSLYKSMGQSHVLFHCNELNIVINVRLVDSHNAHCNNVCVCVLSVSEQHYEQYQQSSVPSP